MHKSVCVKTNVYVDEKIAPVVDALSHIDGLVTLQSCENHFNNGIAQITFMYKNEWNKWVNIGKLCATISAALCRGFEDTELSIRWQPYWTSSSEGVFKFRVNDACEIAKVLKTVFATS